MTAADQPTASDDGGVNRSRRGMLTMSAVAIGAGAAAVASACQRSEADAVEVEVSARSVLAALSTTADAQTNSAALDTAINGSVASGADVVLPGGEYAFAGLTLPIKGRVNVRGAGRGITVLRNEGTGAAVTAHGVPGGDEYLSDWSLSGVTLIADGKGRDLVGLSVKLASRFSVSDVTVFGHGVGVRHESGWDGGYDGVSVSGAGTGWLFPRSDFAPTSPLGLRNCSAVDSDTAVSIENGVEALEWIGGDFAGCGRGMVVLGNDTRSISLHGINFERIRDEDLVVGDDETGPAAITLNGCRFLRVTKGGSSVRFVRGDALTFTSSRWTGYRTAVDQGPDSGTLVVNTSTGYEVDQFITSSGGVQAQGVLNASAGGMSLVLAVDGTSYLPAVAGREGVTTKVLSGPGTTTVTDRDFALAPQPGCTAVLRDEADGSIRHAVRGVTGWFVSTPYLPARRP